METNKVGKSSKLVTKGSKFCSKCGVKRHISRFSKNAGTKDGRRSQCKECNKLTNKAFRTSNPTHRKEWGLANPEWEVAWKAAHPDYNKEYYQNNKVQVNATLKQTKYGITEVEYQELMAIKKCPVCRTEMTEGYGSHARNIEHNHGTGKVRGVLCTTCNARLYFAGDNLKNVIGRRANSLRLFKTKGDLKRLIRYLKQGDI